MKARREGNSVFNGFCHRPFNEETDGWMDEQLEPDMIPSVQIAKDILALYTEVNELRRENWHLKKSLERWEKVKPI